MKLLNKITEIAGHNYVKNTFLLQSKDRLCLNFVMNVSYFF